MTAAWAKNRFSIRHKNHLRMGKCDWKWSKRGGFHETDGSEDGTEGSQTSLQELCRRFCHFKSWVCNAQLSNAHIPVSLLSPVDWISRICRISIKLVAFGILMRNYFVPDLVTPKIHICPMGQNMITSVLGILTLAILISHWWWCDHPPRRVYRYIMVQNQTLDYSGLYYIYPQWYIYIYIPWSIYHRYTITCP